VSAVLVFDVGTSGLKAAVFDANGEVLGRAEAAYPASAVPHRQSPEGWWRAAVEAMDHVGSHNIGAIVLTGTMENLIPVSKTGQGLGDAILYSDPCGEGYVSAYAERLAEAGAAGIAGNSPEPLMTAFKLAWLCENAPATFAEAGWFLPGSKDYLALRLTGKVVTDPTCAATTGLMDIATRDWSDALLEVFGIERRRLPEILPAATMIGGVSKSAAAALGVEPGIPVINGCGDAGATTIGGGADKAEDVSLYLGTTGWVARVVAADAHKAARPFYRLPHPLTEGLIEIAPILSGGAAAAWARDAFNVDVALAESLAAVVDRAPGGLVFLPYLNGERSPFLDLDVRASFLGVSAGDGAGALYYAVLEGVAFAIAENLDTMGRAGSGRVSLVGGGALSKVWPAIIADVLGTPIVAPGDPLSATSFGAFRIAQRALGLAETSSSFGVVASPRAERAERIARQRERFVAGTRFAREFG